MNLSCSKNENNRWAVHWEELRDVLIKQNIPVRLLGSAAVLLICRERNIPVPDEFVPRDIDLIVDRAGSKDFATAMVEIGAKYIPEISMYSGGTREGYIFRRIQVDVFIDPFTMCRKIRIGKRINYFGQTLSPGDLFLTIMQEFQIKPRGLQLACWLLRAYPIGSPGSRYLEVISEICGNDWGLSELVMENCQALANFVAAQAGGFDSEGILTSINQVTSTLRNCRKTLKWQLRSLFGRLLPWYYEVEELDNYLPRASN